MRKEHEMIKYSTDWIGGIIFFSLIGCFVWLLFSICKG